MVAVGAKLPRRPRHGGASRSARRCPVRGTQPRSLWRQDETLEGWRQNVGRADRTSLPAATRWCAWAGLETRAGVDTRNSGCRSARCVVGGNDSWRLISLERSRRDVVTRALVVGAPPTYRMDGRWLRRTGYTFDLRRPA